MRIEEIRPKIRFAEKLEYTAARAPSKPYDCRMLYVTEGAGVVSVGDKRYEIKAGLLIAFWGGTVYSFSPSPCFTAYAVDFDLVPGYDTESGFLPPVPLRLFDSSRLHEVPKIENSELFSLPYVSYASRSVGERLRSLTAVFSSKGRFAKARAELMLAELLLSLEDSIKEEKKSVGCAAMILEYIDAHFSEEITLESCAELLRLNKSYLCRLFRAATGSTLWDFINFVRVCKSEEMLAGKMNLSEISYAAGFSSPSYFHRIFKKYKQMSPSEYRKRYSGGGIDPLLLS